MNFTDFKKFAAELVSPSEVFEPRGKTRLGMAESLELLGSLANLTRSSLAQKSGNQSNSNELHPEHPSKGDAGTAVHYGTSKTEYRQALEDQKIGEALAQLHLHREAHSKKREQEKLKSRGFTAVQTPQVSATIKPAPLTRSSTFRSSQIYQPILSTNQPSSDPTHSPKSPQKNTPWNSKE